MRAYLVKRQCHQNIGKCSDYGSNYCTCKPSAVFVLYFVSCTHGRNHRKSGDNICYDKDRLNVHTVLHANDFQILYYIALCLDKKNT